jgi:4-hydroxybenzoate polyprenyltransferase
MAENAPDQPTRRHDWGVAWGAAAVCLAASAAVSPRAALAAVAMLALNAAYSLPPVRIAGRGALAQVLLPLEYCAFPAFLVPQAVGLAGGGGPAGGLGAYCLMAASMYVIFVGRVFLKDIRDEAGDRATGKLTFTVRHGKRAAVWWSTGTTVAGTVALSAVMFLYYEANPGFVFGFCALSLTGQVIALAQADRAPVTADAVGYTGVYGRWISMKIFFYVMLMLLLRAGSPLGTQALVLGGVTLAIVCNVATLYQQIARQRVRRAIAGRRPGPAA